MLPLVLASQSPRRKEILSFFTYPFIQVISHFDESSIPFEGHAEKYVQDLAFFKARTIQHTYPDHVIVSADTIVYYKGKIFGKPANKEEAFAFFRELQGNMHEVMTGLCVYSPAGVFQTIEKTYVTFNALSEEHISLYHTTLHFLDKAGGYRIQGAGGLIVKSIQGCYYNVMGLPLNALSHLLKQAGIDLWHYLKED